MSSESQRNSLKTKKKKVKDIAAKSELDLTQVTFQLVLSGQAVKPLDYKSPTFHLRERTIDKAPQL